MTDQRGPSGARVGSVTAGGSASRSGVRSGDLIIAVDGEALRDIIQWQWHTSETKVRVDLTRTSGRQRAVILERRPDEPFGITLEGDVFDGVMTCDNRCEFCFLSGMPPGLRPSLYVRDDDYRLSFLHGNFITLTNLADRDIDRILQMRLSPLYVSLHAVRTSVRQRLVGCVHEDRAVSVLERLLDGGIECHVQIVIVPGVNDGEVLEETIAWLSSREGVLSVGIVPAGRTRMHPRLERTCSVDEARELLAAITPWRIRMQAKEGISWIHAADELYLKAGEPLPVVEEYDGYPQYENGIGMVRAFLEEVEREPQWHVGSRCTIVTGASFGPVLSREVAARTDGRVRMLVVENAFFGSDVTVAGLLTAEDVTSSILIDGGGGRYLVSDGMFNPDRITLDGATIQEMHESTGAQIESVAGGGVGLMGALAL